MGLSGNHTGPGRGNPRRAGKDVSEQMMFKPTFEGCKEMVIPILVVVSLMNAFQVGMPSSQSDEHVWGSGGKTGFEISICCSIWIVVYSSVMSNFNSVYFPTHEQVCETQKVLNGMQNH